MSVVLQGAFSTSRPPCRRSTCAVLPRLAIALLAALALSGPGGTVEADEVVLQDGSRIVGEILDLVGGSLRIKTAAAGEVTIKWSEVTAINTEKDLPIHLAGGSVYKGRAVTDNGKVSVQSSDSTAPIPLEDLSKIVSINPPIKPPVKYTGHVTLGGSLTDGNTRTRTLSTAGEFEARAKRQRFLASAAYNYAEDQDSVTARNARGSMKYDFFVTDRFYVFAGSLFEGDSFQNLKLRTALSAGPGYQIIDVGDFERELFSQMALFAEAGLAFFNEDFRGSTEDETFVSARWSVKFDWPILPDRLAFYHIHEGFPGLERAADLYVRTDQGIRITIVENLFASFSVQWRWDNTPANGRKRGDTTYLASIGYNFSF